VHPREKRDPLKGQGYARGDVEVCGCVGVSSCAGPGVSTDKTKVPFPVMRSFAPFDLDAAIPTLSEINANVIGRIAAGTVGIEPCLQ
jgi:hypothetical protein